MQRSLLLLFLFLFVGATFQAQSFDFKIPYSEIEAGLNEIHLPENAVIDPTDAPFITFALTAELKSEVAITGFSLMLFYETDEQKFNFSILKQETHATLDKFVSQLLFLPPSARNFNFKINKAQLKEDSELAVYFYNPKHTPAQEDQATERQLEECNCPQPEFQDRADWCPTGNCPEIQNPVITDVSHLIVHHSAGVNTSSDWAATVRGIWNFHVNTNGWDDVGYNWLIDPNGVLYEGRGDDVRGAHFCGNNTGTQGICMLGTYIEEAPSEEAMTTLKEYLAWKSANDNIDPTAISFHNATGDDVPNVAGHRDGCSTTCPGNALYGLMPQLRTDIRQHQARICGHPHSVTDFTVEQTSPNAIALAWVDNSITEDAYLIQRAEGNTGTFTTIDELPTDTEAYIDTDFAPSTLYRYQVLSMAGDSVSTCQLEVEILTEMASSNNSILSEREVSISPNPASNFVSVHLKNSYEGRVNIELRDVSGKLLQDPLERKKIGEEINVNLTLSEYPTGIYLVKIIAGNASGTFRLVKD